MAMLDELKNLGVDVDKALTTLAGKTSLYERLVMKFYTMLNEYAISPDFDNHDYNEMIEKTHALKGAAGNLSITPLYNAYTEIVDLLRQDRPEEAKEVLREILPLQEDIMQCIKKNMLD